MKSLPPREQPESSREAVEQLAEEFVNRYRRGERPSISEYCARLPDQEAEIRDLFPALVLMENIAPDDSEGGISHTSRQSEDNKPYHPLDRLGDYRIIREVGRGGMGVVYEAEQISLARHVALKVLPRHASRDAKSLGRFRREARAAAKLHHTNIVPIFEVGEVDGIRFYAMQYIPGQSLDHVLEELRRFRTQVPVRRESHGDASQRDISNSSDAKSRHYTETERIARALASGEMSSPIPRDWTNRLIDRACNDVALSSATTKNVESESAVPLETRPNSGSISLPGFSALTLASGVRFFESVARIGVQVAQALSYAHDRGILHRDIKPSNLLLDLAGTVWVTDFGLAKEEQDGLTETGDIVGTLRYMAPERFRGGGDRRGDIYSLGITLYELATLRPAFQESDHLRLIERITRSAPVRPRSIDQRIPPDLETVILKSIDRDAGRRYQTGQQFADDLQCFLEGRPIKARRVGWSEHTWRWCCRNPIVATLLSLTAVLLIAITSVAIIDAEQMRRQLDRTKQAEDQEHQERHQRELALFDAYLQQAKAERSSHRAGQRFQTLDAVRKALKLGDKLGMTPTHKMALRNEAIAGLALPDMRVVAKFPIWQPGTVTITFDGKFTRYARASRSGEVTVRDLERDHEIANLSHVIGVKWLDLSRDGRYLCGNFGADSRTHLWDLGISPPKLLVTEQTPSRYSSDFSPNVALFAFIDSQGQVMLLDLPTGGVSKPLLGATGATRLAFHPTQHQIAVLHGQKEIRIFKLESGELLYELPQPNYVDQFAWSPDGQTMAVVGFDRRICVWNVAQRRIVNTLLGHRKDGIIIAFNPSGDLIFSRDWSGSTRLWDARHGIQLFQSHNEWHSTSFHVDQDRFWMFDSEAGDVEFWDFKVGREHQTLSHSTVVGAEVHMSTAISPDGRLLVVALEYGLAFWDLQTSEALGEILTGRRERITFDRNGTLFTNSPHGVLRGKFEMVENSRNTWRLSIPEQLPLAGSDRMISCSRDGSVVATPQWHGAAVLHCGNPDGSSPGRVVTLSEHFDTRNVAVSPDGRWVATGSHGGTGVKIWNAATGQFERDLLSQEAYNLVGFSPDGKWLLTNGRGCQLWNVGDWTEAAKIGGNLFTFSGDSRLLAVRSTHGIIRIVDLVSKRDVANLEDPMQDIAASIEFSPDGRKLVTVDHGTTQAIHVWDLGLIRDQLAELDLDWDRSSLPQHQASENQRDANSNAISLELTEWGLPQRTSLHSLKLIVDQQAITKALEQTPPLLTDAYRRGHNQLKAGAWSSAITEFEAAIKQSPSSADAYNELAWLFATCPDPEWRNAQRAVELAETAVSLESKSAIFLNTLGVAEYRDCQWRKAIEKLEQAERMDSGKYLGINGFFLAMAFTKLGERDTGLEWLAKSVAWCEANRESMAKTPDYLEELMRFRSEAEELLNE